MSGNWPPPQFNDIIKLPNGSLLIFLKFIQNKTAYCNNNSLRRASRGKFDKKQQMGDPVFVCSCGSFMITRLITNKKNTYNTLHLSLYLFFYIICQSSLLFGYKIDKNNKFPDFVNNCGIDKYCMLIL